MYLKKEISISFFIITISASNLYMPMIWSYVFLLDFLIPFLCGPDLQCGGLKHWKWDIISRPEKNEYNSNFDHGVCRYSPKKMKHCPIAADFCQNLILCYCLFKRGLSSGRNWKDPSVRFSTLLYVNKSYLVKETLGLGEKMFILKNEDDLRHFAF